MQNKQLISQQLQELQEEVSSGYFYKRDRIKLDKIIQQVKELEEKSRFNFDKYSVEELKEQKEIIKCPRCDIEINITKSKLFISKEKLLKLNIISDKLKLISSNNEEYILIRKSDLK